MSNVIRWPRRMRRAIPDGTRKRPNLLEMLAAMVCLVLLAAPAGLLLLEHNPDNLVKVGLFVGIPFVVTAYYVTIGWTYAPLARQHSREDNEAFFKLVQERQEREKKSK